MHDHDVDAEGAVERRPRHGDDLDAPGGRELGHGVEAARPDALGPAGLLHLQRVAGNSGVSGLVAQRRAEDEHDGHDHGDGDSPVKEVVSQRGTPLDPSTRRSMEQAVGHDFGDVEVHTDAKAADSARSVQAQAYTVGNHVVFGEGRYQPETPEGRRTLAHELTHVVQQRQGPVDGTEAPGGIRVSDPSDRFEREAESVADGVMSAPATDAAPASGGGEPVQREAAVPVAETPVQRQADGEQAEEEEAPPAEAAELESAGPDQAGAAPEAAGQEAPTEAGAAGGGAAPGPEAGAEPAPPAEGGSEAVAEQTDADVPQKADENEDESVTEE
jgi:hypothetical protein